MLAWYTMLGWVLATTAGPNRVELNTPGHTGGCLGENHQMVMLDPEKARARDWCCL